MNWSRNVRAVAMVLSLAFVIVMGTTGCTMPDPVACASYPEEPDVAGLFDEADVVVIGEFTQTGPDSAEILVDTALKGTPKERETVPFIWPDDCGVPSDFVTQPPGEAGARFVYFLNSEGKQLSLSTSAYGMFDAEADIVREVTDAAEAAGN